MQAGGPRNMAAFESALSYRVMLYKPVIMEAFFDVFNTISSGRFFPSSDPIFLQKGPVSQPIRNGLTIDMDLIGR